MKVTKTTNISAHLHHSVCGRLDLSRHVDFPERIILVRGGSQIPIGLDEVAEVQRALTVCASADVGRKEVEDLGPSEAPSEEQSAAPASPLDDLSVLISDNDGVTANVVVNGVVLRGTTADACAAADLIGKMMQRITKLTRELNRKEKA